MTEWLTHTIFHLIYVPHLLYPFICQETFRWLPCLATVNSATRHWGPRVFFFFYFTILYWFCHTSTCIRHRCTCTCTLSTLILLLSFHPSWNQVISNCMIHLSSNFLEDVLGYILMTSRRVFTTNRCIFSLNSLCPLILPTLDYIAANLFIKSLPRRGTGHSGIYRKEWVEIMDPSP